MFDFFNKKLEERIVNLESKNVTQQDNLNQAALQINDLSKKLESLSDKVEELSLKINNLTDVCKDLSLALKGNYELVKNIVAISSKS